MISLSDRSALGRELRAAGVFRSRDRLTILKTALHLGVGGVLALVAAVSPTWLAVILVPVAAMIYVVGVMMGHDGTHGAASTSSSFNTAHRHVCFPLASGMSGVFWRYKHNVLHHSHPNVLERDEDIEIFPLAQGRAYHESSPPAFRWLQRALPGWAFWFAAACLPLDLRRRALIHLVSRVRAGRVDTDLAVDCAALAAHAVLWLVLPAQVWSPVSVIAFYLYFWAVAGVWLAIVGLAGHAALPLVDKVDDLGELTFHTTRNLDLGPVVSWWFCGLDYQIEHHLFPDIPSFNLARAAPIVRRFAEARGLPYRVQRLGPCLATITRYFGRAWDDPAYDLVDGQLVPTPTRPLRRFDGRLRTPRP